MFVINSILCYPPGECHPDALLDTPPEGEELSGNQEVYDFQASTTPPYVGEAREYPEGRWIVTEVDYYSSSQTTSIQGFYTAVCTKDGKPQEREEAAPDFRVLGLVMNGDEIVERSPGLADWWVGSELSIPKPSAHQEVLKFSSDQGRPKGGYDLMVITQTQPVLVAA
jgi:hypothetical protein